MRTFTTKMLKITCLFVFLFALHSCSRVTGIQEIESNSQAQNQAPAESLTAFRKFFAYVQNPKPSIVTDEQAQNRWLTQRMRKAFVSHIKRSGRPSENPAFPSNATFTRVWNKPTTYSIVGSRHYDHRNNNNPNDNRAVIDVLYEWSTDTNRMDNEYPGERSLYSYIFVYEDGGWKLDDIYTFDDVYTSAQSLRDYFEDERQA